LIAFSITLSNTCRMRSTSTFTTSATPLHAAGHASKLRAMSDALHVLVVDDEPNIRATLAMCLESLGCEVHRAAGAREALVAVEATAFDIAFVDVRLGPADGLQLLPELVQRSPRLDVVMITAYASIESAVEAIKAGAADYLAKPFTPAQIRHVVERLRKRRALENQVHELQERLEEAAPQVLLESTSPAMRAVIDTLTQAAGSDASVLLRGESGTGKGVLARLVHARSPRAHARFVTVNCPTLTDELLASELFGHVRGAFTGAVRDQAGKVEEADGGTLLLDEVGEISAALQAKLLRFSQDREFERVGETRTRRANVRIVAATNRDLEHDVAEGRFRLDLLYRLNVIEVRVPALRERREDLLVLARRFVEFFSHTLGRPSLRLSPPAEALLLAYAWPGNVRELRNEMERAVVLSRSPELGPESFSERVRGAAAPLPEVGGPFRLEDIEREHILRVLASVPTRDEAARILGIDPSTLWRKLRRYETEAGQP
jgi:two-component system, NtrC family, response regulator AlgB